MRLNDTTLIIRGASAITGGVAASETTPMEAIEGVWWEHLMPECL